MPTKWPAKIFIVISMLVGIYYGADARDRDRWMAALRMSASSATKLRAQNQREKYLAYKAAEEARWRGAAQATSDASAEPGLPLSRDEVCAALRSREALIKNEGLEPDRGLEKMKLICSDPSF